MDKRLEIAADVTRVFSGLPEVAEVALRGSLANQTADEYSDIDIGIDVSGHSNAAFAKSVAEHMEAAFDLHFSDWATSLLPSEYVQSFFIKGLPVFWNVDVQVTADPHHATLTGEDVERDPLAGFLKVWAANTKYLLRGTDGIEDNVRQYYFRVFREPPPGGRGPEQLLAGILDELRQRAAGQFSGFFDCCYEIRDQHLTT